MKRVLFLPFFFLFLILGMVADTELLPNAVDLADTHTHVKLLLEQRLDDG